MFVRIGNTPRDYAWGSTSAISELLGTTASGAPEAELWLGAHPGSPSTILDPAEVGGAGDLASWIAADPAEALGDVSAVGLPFLLKVLAAAAPLSLQAHPSPEQAREGFERENAAGIALDDPTRNYKDPFHKPELIFALGERFEALCGFRPLAETAAVFRALAAAADARDARAIEAFVARLALDRAEDATLHDAVALLLNGGPEVTELVDAVVAAAKPGAVAQGGAAAVSGGFERECETVATLAAASPGDAGIVLALLLNRVTLHSGEALYLPAGNIHAYLNGLGIELMAASDNVLRGGLTGKHVDKPELLRVLDFSPLPVPYLRPEHPAPGVEVFRPDVPDFALTHVLAHHGDGPLALAAGPSILLCVSGEVSVAGAASHTVLHRGESMYVTPDEGVPSAQGNGEFFVASRNA